MAGRPGKRNAVPDQQLGAKTPSLSLDRYQPKGAEGQADEQDEERGAGVVRAIAIGTGWRQRRDTGRIGRFALEGLKGRC
jgi:hypothetical protein